MNYADVVFRSVIIVVLLVLMFGTGASAQTGSLPAAVMFWTLAALAVVLIADTACKFVRLEWHLPRRPTVEHVLVPGLPRQPRKPRRVHVRELAFGR